MYLPVKMKIAISVSAGAAAVALSYVILEPWLNQMIASFTFTGGYYFAWAVMFFLALVPGFSNALIVSSLLIDKRPKFEELDDYPDVTVLMAAFNEEECIAETLDSISSNGYKGNINVIVIDDGSSDKTLEVVYKESTKQSKPANFDITVSPLGKNIGKAAALMAGLAQVKTKYFMTIDADTLLHTDALKNIVTNIVSGPEGTGAVAGTPLVRNSRASWMTRMQEWDYFHYIAVSKRVQSLFQGTLVAQGAFSIYDTAAVRDVGGWPATVGEDILLTWALRAKKYRVSYDETAIGFTNVPETYGQFFHQRKRWARGLVEVLKIHPEAIWQVKKNSPFIWISAMIPFVDLFYLVVFLPAALSAAIFGANEIVGLWVLWLMPLFFALHAVYFYKQSKIFKDLNLKVRKNKLGFIVYVIVYQMCVAPAAVAGYISEIFNMKKTWGTK